MISNNTRRKNLNYMYRLLSTIGGANVAIKRDPFYTQYDVCKFTILVDIKTKSTLRSIDDAIVSELLNELGDKSRLNVINNAIHSFYFNDESCINVVLLDGNIRISC